MEYAEYDHAVAKMLSAQAGFKTIWAKIDTDANGFEAIVGENVANRLTPGYDIMGDEISWNHGSSIPERVCNATIRTLIREEEWEEARECYLGDSVQSMNDWADAVDSATEILWDWHIEELENRRKFEEED